MPKIQPTSADERQAFRRTLSPAHHQVFDRLAALIDAPRQDLDWYHAVGRLTAELRPDAARGGYHGAAWFVGLAGALGPRRWFFHKAARLVELYPTDEALQKLKCLGADWTRVSLSFAVARAKERHAFLREAVREGWTIPRFRYALQERFPTPSRGVGGRRRHAPGRWGSEGRACASWGVWSRACWTSTQAPGGKSRPRSGRRSSRSVAGRKATRCGGCSTRRRPPSRNWPPLPVRWATGSTRCGRSYSIGRRRSTLRQPTNTVL